MESISYRIDFGRHQSTLRSRLELLDQPGPKLPVLTRSCGLEVLTDARGATRVRRPGVTPWLSID